MISNIFHEISQFGIIPVIKINEADNAIDLMAALIAGGLPCIEITFRTNAAFDSIKRISSKYREALVGAGTVLTIEQARLAYEAGAKFIVSPGFDADLAHWCFSKDLAYAPGIATPTEIITALKENLRVLKYFPAEELGGARMIKALAAPFSEIKFIPTGGINQENLATYLSLPSVLACGGSWIAKSEYVSNRNFDLISQLAAEALSVAQKYRGKKS